MATFAVLRRRILTLALLAAAALPAASAVEPPAAAELDTAFFAIKLPEFFGKNARGTSAGQLKIFAVRRDGKWVAGLANSNSDTGRPAYNTALYPVDMSQVTIANNTLAGKAKVTLTPDPWVPKDHKPRVVELELSAKIVAPNDAKTEKASLDGTYIATVAGDAAELAAVKLAPRSEGKIVGGIGGTAPNNVAEASYDLAVYGLLPGNAKDEFQRRRAISIGIKDGAAVSGRLGQMDIRHNAYDYETFDTPENFTVTSDTLSGSLSFSADTLDGERASFSLALEGQRVAGWAVGTWKGKYTTEDGKEREISGFFRGTVNPKPFVAATAVKDDRPWFVPAAGVKPFEPGEHPRLFFRKSDVPELKRRAETPDGQKIIKRLRQLLNGGDGESMPTSFNPAKKAYAGGFKETTGTYTISHGAGFGFLFQLTGDKKYADLARECVIKGFEGQRNGDDRYSWVGPGGELRAGPSIAWTAVAYDLCYDAWDKDFRESCAKTIQNYEDKVGGEWNVAEQITLRSMVLTPKQGPKSNHYGAVVGGCGLAVLAIKDDPGTDQNLCAKYMEVLEKEVVRSMSAGWGDGGYYAEGWGASTVGTQGGMLCFIQALRTATGHDYMNVERPNVNYVTMIPRCMLLMGPPAKIQYRSNMGGTYGSENFDNERAGFSHGGHFSEGFGAIADKYKPALLWTYNHVVDVDAEKDFDMNSHYPHRAMLALINWPTFAGMQEKSPEEILPLATRDRLWEFFCFRNGFKGKGQDILTSVVINDSPKPREILVWGLDGLRLSFGEPRFKTPVTHYAAEKDGSGTITAGDWAFCVDYSKKSGADALIVSTNAVKGADMEKSGGKAKVTVLGTPGKGGFSVLTLSAAGVHPAVTLEGNVITAGERRVVFKDGKLGME